MTAALALYAECLRRGAVDSDDVVLVRYADGSTRPLPVSQWMRVADAVDEHALSPLTGPVLDIGCGPGRHLHALAARGVFGLGVDLSPAAVTLARGGGANAIVGSIFGELPGAGRWSSALLLDGNIGIGGEPRRLLRRVSDLLAAEGRTLVELAAPHSATHTTRVRLEANDRHSDWFAWAEVSLADIGTVAADAGLAVQRRWERGGRWFALLVSA